MTQGTRIEKMLRAEFENQGEKMDTKQANQEIQALVGGLLAQELEFDDVAILACVVGFLVHKYGK
jgi:hypothetical protein